jgi:hypothetical protein
MTPRNPTLLLFTLVWLSSCKDAEGPEARVRIDQPEFDYGALWSGRTIHHTFLIHNDGRVPLRLESLQPS